MAKEIGTVEQAVQDLRDGKVILVIDDPERENEGDLICAAEFATTENVNFMASYAKGLICMPMDQAHIQKLGLRQMVANNTDNHSTAFTESIDHVHTTTGISAEERGLTARMCVDPNAAPADFRRPGHMFPLEARAGGVLRRNGHTEATVDLLRLDAVDEVHVVLAEKENHRSPESDRKSGRERTLRHCVLNNAGAAAGRASACACRSQCTDVCAGWE